MGLKSATENDTKNSLNSAALLLVICVTVALTSRSRNQS